jgi:hypothetical protein
MSWFHRENRFDHFGRTNFDPVVLASLTLIKPLSERRVRIPEFVCLLRVSRHATFAFSVAGAERQQGETKNRPPIWGPAFHG